MIFLVKVSRAIILISVILLLDACETTNDPTQHTSLRVQPGKHPQPVVSVPF